MGRKFILFYSFKYLLNSYYVSRTQQGKERGKIAGNFHPNRERRTMKPTNTHVCVSKVLQRKVRVIGTEKNKGIYFKLCFSEEEGDRFLNRSKSFMNYLFDIRKHISLH